MLLLAQLLTTNLLQENRMTIKIVLATAAFGFAACNTLAMENLEKLTTNGRNIQVFLVDTKGSLGYVGNTQYTTDCLRPSILQHIQMRLRFGTKFALEKALAENNFTPCTFSSGREAIVCGATDKKYCNYAEELMAIKAAIGRMSYNDPEGHSSNCYNHDDCRCGNY